MPVLFEAGDTITVQRAKDLIEAQQAQPRAEEATQAAQTDAQRLRQQIEQHEAATFFLRLCLNR